jgi:hypothetical protein
MSLTVHESQNITMLVFVYSQTQHIIVDKTLDRRRVSAQNIAIFRPYANIRTDHCTALVGGDIYII